MGRPSSFELHLVELANRFRLDPRGEFDRLILDAQTRSAADSDVSAALRFFAVDMEVLRTELAALRPAAPLAWNSALHRAAEGHSERMRDAQVQSHQLPGEPALGARIAAEGYVFTVAGENVFAWTESPEHGHAGFVIDWGRGPGGAPTADGMQPGRGHRELMIDPRFAEVGVSALPAPEGGTVGPWVVTQNFGARAEAGPFVTGVAFRDSDGDGAYSLGEGMQGVRLIVQGAGEYRSGVAGELVRGVSEGVQTITLRGPGVEGPIRLRLEVGTENVKLDIVDGRDLRTSADLELLSAARSVSVLGTEGRSLTGSAEADRLIGGKGWDRLFGNDGADLLRGGPGRDRLEGGAGADRLRGEGGADRLFGGRGADDLRGGEGADLIRGGPGDDALRGGPGADTLAGGPGDDRLWGGRGADLFVFGPADGTDRVKDWEDGLDRIELGVATLQDVTISDTAWGHARLSFGATVVIVEGAAGLIGPDDLLLA